MARLDRESAAFADDDRCIAEEGRDARAVEGRGHGDEPQILAQPGLRVERQRETKIGIERALVELVEDHGRDAGERGIVEDEAREHAFRHDFEAGVARDARTEPHAQAHGPADVLASEASPCARPRRGPRAGAARGEEGAALASTARREAPRARASSCPRPSARRSRRWGRRRNAARISGRRSSIGSGVSSTSRMAIGSGVATGLRGFASRAVSGSSTFRNSLNMRQGTPLISAHSRKSGELQACN